jgi:hypothetical protein
MTKKQRQPRISNEAFLRGPAVIDFALLYLEDFSRARADREPMPTMAQAVFPAAAESLVGSESLLVEERAGAVPCDHGIWDVRSLQIAADLTR